MLKFMLGALLGGLLTAAVLGGDEFVMHADRQSRLAGNPQAGIESQALELHEAICSAGQIAICK